MRLCGDVPDPAGRFGVDSIETPVRNPSVVSKKLGDETVLYDQAGRAIHVLNPTAVIVWDMCDGRHTAQDMARSLRSGFQTGQDTDILEDVKGIVKRFRAEGLLQESPPHGT
jgi:hypothetical protein